ncbi:MAG TPA: sulfotransferase [Candidatus Dormibacteraeota bacterium]
MPPVPALVDADALMFEAAQQTGSDDFGAESFAAALQLLVASCAERGVLTELGWRVLRSSALRHLRNRVAVRSYLRAHPGVETSSTDRPIVVTGMPRTGTTVLHELLALDTAHRSLRLWEALLPVPVTSAAERDARIEQAGRWLERFYGAVPGFVRIHALRPDGPEECDTLLQNAFASQHFDDMFDAPAYSEWLATDGLGDAYAFYAAQLRILTAADPGRRAWVLKSPIHLGHLDALLAVLPGALVVHCHRDPMEAVPSHASLIATLRRAYSERVDPREVGHQAVTRCAVAIDRAMRVRDTVTSGQFIDVAYADIERDPLAVLRSVYQAAGRQLDAGLEGRMRDWLRGNPRDARGRHEYGAGAFGIDAAMLRRALGPYLERFAAQLRWT